LGPVTLGCKTNATMPKIKVTLLAQVVGLLDRDSFRKIVSTRGTDKHHKGINSWTHMLSMLFCHLGKAGSVREISQGLKSITGNLSHLGIAQAPSKSSISYINKHRDWRLFRDYYFELLAKLEGACKRKRQYALRLKRKIYLMDATVVPLCLKLFDWARFRRRKGAIKLHTILDYDTSLPVFLHLTDGKVHDVTVARDVTFPPGSVVVADRAYVDFDWLFNLDSSGVFFVTRLKRNAQIEQVTGYLTDDRNEYILADEDIRLTGFYTSQKYPNTLRVVRVLHPETQKELVFVTNQMSWTAQTISELYHARWDIEVFFKHIKQVLKIKTFVGTSPNAVLIQVWTAMIAILLLKYLQAKAKFNWHLSNLVSFLRLNMFVKIDLWEWLDTPMIREARPPPQPTLFSLG